MKTSFLLKVFFSMTRPQKNEEQTWMLRHKVVFLFFFFPFFPATSACMGWFLLWCSLTVGYFTHLGNHFDGLCGKAQHGAEKGKSIDNVTRMRSAFLNWNPFLLWFSPEVQSQADCREYSHNGGKWRGCKIRNLGILQESVFKAEGHFRYIGPPNKLITCNIIRLYKNISDVTDRFSSWPENCKKLHHFCPWAKHPLKLRAEGQKEKCHIQ